MLNKLRKVMANYMQTNSFQKSVSIPSVDERRKRDLIKKAMESSISCNFQIFLAIIDQNHRLSIFTNEGNPENFIESYLTNVSFLKDNLSLKDYSNICQEETDLPEEKEININTLTNRIDSFDNEKKPITNFNSVKSQTNNQGDSQSFFRERQFHCINSSKKPFKDKTMKIKFKIPKINNSFDEVDYINSDDVLKGNWPKKSNHKGMKNRISEGRIDTKVNIIHSEDFNQSSFINNNAEPEIYNSKRRNKENNKIKRMQDCHEEITYQHEATLKNKRMREEEKITSIFDNFSPRLSDTKEPFFQNDNFRLFKNNDLMLSSNFPVIDQSLTQPPQHLESIININKPIETAEEPQIEKNKNSLISKISNTLQSKTNRDSGSNRKKEYAPTSRYKNKIIIVEEEGGKATVITKDELGSEEYLNHVYEKKKVNNNYILFHSNNDID